MGLTEFKPAISLKDMFTLLPCSTCDTCAHQITCAINGVEPYTLGKATEDSKCMAKSLDNYFALQFGLRDQQPKEVVVKINVR